MCIMWDMENLRRLTVVECEVTDVFLNLNSIRGRFGLYIRGYNVAFRLVNVNM